MKVVEGNNVTYNLKILGEDWTLDCLRKEDSKFFNECDGWTDKTIKKMAIIGQRADDCELSDWEVYAKKCKRHEIIHAYLFESGLAENMESVRFGHPEELVDWFAIQIPKILKTFQEADAL